MGDATIPNTSPKSRGPRTGLWLALLVLAVCLALAPGAIDNIDTRVCFRSAASFLDRGTFALPEPTDLERRGLWAAQGTVGEWYPKFGPAVAWLLLPFVAAGRALAGVLGAPAPVAQEFLASLSSSFFVAVGAHAAYRLGREALALPARAAVAGTLAWALGTFQFSYAGSSYLETPLGTASLLALLWATRCDRRPVLAPLACGALAGLVVAIKAAAVVYVPFLLVPLLTRDVRALARRAALAALPLAAAAGALLATNAARFGHPLSTGYAPVETLFRTPLATGLGGYLLDPDLSIVLFAPAFVVSIAGWREFVRRAPLVFAGALGLFVAGAVLHAVHTGYHGGTVLGPRYLVPLLPALTAGGVGLLWQRTEGGAGGTTTGRRALAAALAACVLVQVPSVLVSPNEYHTIRGAFRERGRALDDVRPRWQTDPMLLARKLRGEADRYDLRDFARDPSRAPSDPWYDVPRADRTLAVWWVLAAREGRPAGWLAGAALAAFAAYAALRTRRAAASEA